MITIGEKLRSTVQIFNKKVLNRNILIKNALNQDVSRKLIKT